MVFDCRSSAWVWNPLKRVDNFNRRTDCCKIKVSTCLYSNSYFVYVFVSEIIYLIESHFFSVKLPHSISVLCSFCVSCTSSCPFSFWSIRISNSHLHSECLKYGSYLYLILITTWRKENLFVFSFLLSYLLNRIISYKIFLLDLLEY